MRVSLSFEISHHITTRSAFQCPFLNISDRKSAETDWPRLLRKGGFRRPAPSLRLSFLKETIGIKDFNVGAPKPHEALLLHLQQQP